MSNMHRARFSSFGEKSIGIGKMVKLLEDEERCPSRCGSCCQGSDSRSSSVYCDNINSSNATGSEKQENNASFTSSLAFNHLAAIQSVVVGSSDESGSDFDFEYGSRFVPDRCEVPEPGDELSGNKGDPLGIKSGTLTRHRAQSVCPLSWRDQYMLQPARLQDSTSKKVDNGRPERISTGFPSQRAFRRGSSSKSPQTDDLTAPLLLEKKSRSITDKVVQVENAGLGHISVATLGSKNRNASSVRRVTRAASEGSYRRKGNSQTCYDHRAKPEEIGSGHKDMSIIGAGLSRRGLSNLVCSSAADVLPSVSSSMLSNFACSSVADVLPPVPTSLARTSYFRPRKSTRAIGFEGEAGGNMQPVNRQVKAADVLGTWELQNGPVQDQVPHRTSLLAPQSTQAPLSRPEPLRTEFVTCETLMPSSSTPSLPSNYVQWGQNVALPRNGDGRGSLYRSDSPCYEANPAFGEDLSNQCYARRRSLYGSRDPLRSDSRSLSRNFPHGRPSSSSWSVLHETHHPQSRFPGPPACPPPLPPLACFAEPVSSGSSFSTAPPAFSADLSYNSRPSGFVIPNHNAEQTSVATLAETRFLNGSTDSSEGRPRLTAEGLSEILSALELIERDEDLSYEQILMLEATILLGGTGLQDRYRDMRIDIDNMSYEELLALEERIGYVNTGLSEESIEKVQVVIFTSPEVSCGYVPQEIEIKCSICQEEFEETVELGVLECGHSHHIACIKQWLLQKNQCPICKVPAMS